MKFQVFKNGSIVKDFALSGAYLFGGDGIGIRRAQITFQDGFILCKKANLETAGLALLWPIEGFGKVLLPTTCLPERERPYNLNVEITRAKLMQIVNKREDWSFFNSIKGMSELSEEAHDFFIRAIQNISDPPAASKLADEALNRAIELSEKLAIKQAELLFHTRTKSHGFGRGCFSCKIDPMEIDNPLYIEKLLGLFGSVTIPINWAQIESEKGHYNFSKIDACIEVLVKKKLPLSAGPLLCFSEEYLPAWLLNGNESFEKIRETAYQFVTEIVGRYSNIIRAWYTISGLNAFNHFGFRFEQILEMTRAANMAVKQASDRAIKIIEISNPWGEYYTTSHNSIPPLVYMDMVVQSGVNFDAFGLQMRFGKDKAGMHTRDMMQISAILDTFAPIAKPIYITCVEVPSQNGDGENDGNLAGIWHDKWNQKLQAKWINQFFQIALSKPFVNSVTYSNLIDTHDSVIVNSGLLTDQLEPKESYHALKDLSDGVFSR
ncbi:MAG: endo-1,4-beta-xylanase [Sedimentisphaerales bacterium]|nr:endo-1,4-beta-xylanase [Sedimentisphaerales bacterium]